MRVESQVNCFYFHAAGISFLKGGVLVELDQIVLEGQQIIDVQIVQQGYPLADGFGILLCLGQTYNQPLVEGLDVLHLHSERLQLLLQLSHSRCTTALAEFTLDPLHACKQIIAIIGVMRYDLQRIFCDFHEHGIQLRQQIYLQLHLLIFLPSLGALSQQCLILDLYLNLRIFVTLSHIADPDHLFLEVTLLPIIIFNPLQQILLLFCQVHSVFSDVIHLLALLLDLACQFIDDPAVFLPDEASLVASLEEIDVFEMDLCL